MDFDPFKKVAAEDSDKAAKKTFNSFAKEMSSHQLQKRSQALESAALKHILKSLDEPGIYPELSAYQRTIYDNNKPTLLTLAQVYPSFPLLLKARRILRLATLTIGDFLDVSKFPKAQWFNCLLETQELLGGQGKPIGMCFGPAPKVKGGFLVATLDFYDLSRVNITAEPRLYASVGPQKDALVLESMDSFISTLKDRWRK